MNVGNCDIKTMNWTQAKKVVDSEPDKQTNTVHTSSANCIGLFI
jgi:hypothetical protein